jgi:acetyltransferase-like isoleucine patch superfamily enzyme
LTLLLSQATVFAHGAILFVLDTNAVVARCNSFYEMTRSSTSILQASITQWWATAEWIVGSLPGPLGAALRSAFWKRRLRACGRNVRIGVGVQIRGPEWVSIGSNCWIDDYVIIIAGPVQDNGRFIYRKSNPHFEHPDGTIVVGDRVHLSSFVVLQGHGGLSIGDDLTIAAGTKVYTLSHHYRDISGQGDPQTIWKFVGLAPANEQALICAPVVIQDNAAVGLNCVVLPGSTIGRNSWLGTMSLLQGELPPDVIASGVPAKVTRARFS